MNDQTPTRGATWFIRAFLFLLVVGGLTATLDGIAHADQTPGPGGTYPATKHPTVLQRLSALERINRKQADQIDALQLDVAQLQDLVNQAQDSADYVGAEVACLNTWTIPLALGADGFTLNLGGAQATAWLPVNACPGSEKVVAVRPPVDGAVRR